MQIDITNLVSRESFDVWQLSNSVANLGDNAGKITWNNSLNAAKEMPQPLDTEEKQKAFRKFVREYSSELEGDCKDNVELNALFIQWVAGDIREAFGYDLAEDFNEWNWDEYEIDSEKGHVSSNLYKQDGKLYFDLN
jgi:hypothetical protein